MVVTVAGSGGGPMLVAESSLAPSSIDLVISDANTPSLLWLRDDGAGGFLTADALEVAGVGGHFDDLAAADVNHDGYDDVLATDADANLLMVALGTPQHQFGTVHTMVVSGAPTRLAVGDVTGDKTPDVLVITAAGVQILRGSGDGTVAMLSNVPTSTRATDLAVGDVSGDGVDDLLVSLPSEGAVRVFLGNGEGGFDQGPEYQGGRPGALALGQLNTDSWLDLIAANAQDLSLVVRFGSATGLGEERVVTPGVAADQIVAADVDGDRALDLLILQSDGVQVFLGSNDGHFALDAAVMTGGDAGGLAVSDFNGDHRPDFLLTAPTSNEVVIATNTTAAPRLPCVGDCDDNKRVTVDELVRGVDIVLGRTPIGRCFALETNVDRLASVDELVWAVRNALDGCH